MNKLAPSQLVAIQSLAENDLIKNVQIEFEDGISKVTVITEINSNFADINSALMGSLDEEFPGLTYKYDPFKYVHPADRINQELYYIFWNRSEPFIYLILRLAPEMTLDEIVKREA